MPFDTSYISSRTYTPGSIQPTQTWSMPPGSERLGPAYITPEQFQAFRAAVMQPIGPAYLTPEQVQAFRSAVSQPQWYQHPIAYLPPSHPWVTMMPPNPVPLQGVVVATPFTDWITTQYQGSTTPAPRYQQILADQVARGRVSPERVAQWRARGWL